jgi:hypothetical protein
MNAGAQWGVIELKDNLEIKVRRKLWRRSRDCGF